MGFSQLMNELNGLKLYFTGKKTEIDNAVVAAIAAAPESARNWYVDAVAGLDTNAGTNAAPFKTLQKAISMIKPGHLATVYLMSGQTHVLGANAAVLAATLQLRGYGAGAIPVLTMAVTETATYNEINCIPLLGADVLIVGVEIDLPNKVNPAKPWNSIVAPFLTYYSDGLASTLKLSAASGAANIHLRLSEGLGLCRQDGGGLRSLALSSVEVHDKAGTAQAKVVRGTANAPIMLSTINLVLNTGCKLMESIPAHPDGYKSIITNYTGGALV